MNFHIFIYVLAISIGLGKLGDWSLHHFSPFPKIAEMRRFLSVSAMAASLDSPLIVQQSETQPGPPDGNGGDGARNGPMSKDIPHIISPRRTWLRNPNPTLRWTAVEGVEQYTVRVSRGEVEWETDVDGTEVLYDGPALQPGEGYTLTVDANNEHEASEETFTLLSEEKLQELQAEEARLDPALTGEAKDLALSKLYIDRGIYADAIELLAPLVENESPTIEVYCKLGEIYQKIGRNDLINFVLEQAKPVGECPELNLDS